MSLLTICKGAARAAGLAQPTSIYGSTDPTNALLFAAAEEEIESLVRCADWTVLQREYTFLTADGTADYALPGDFQRFIDFTAWDRSDYEAMRGPLSPSAWQAIKSSVLGSSATTLRRWRVKFDSSSAANRFHIDPTPSDVASLVFEYVSNQAVSHSGSLQSAWGADADTSVFDEWLLRLGVKWRVLERLGLAYAEARDEYDRERDKAIARDGGASALALATRPYPEAGLIGIGNVQDGNWG